MAKRWGVDEVGVCVFCVLGCICAAPVYFWGFGNSPFTRKSLFWAAPLLSPVAFLVYFRWKRAGAVVMAALYAAAVMGTYTMLRADCARAGACFTQSRVPLAAASLVAGLHTIFMLGAVMWMVQGAWRVRRVG